MGDGEPEVGQAAKLRDRGMDAGRDKTTRRANDFCFSQIVSRPEMKNISLFPKAKSGLYPLPSRPDQRGVS
jgi:hypothetical protein